MADMITNLGFTVLGFILGFFVQKPSAPPFDIRPTGDLGIPFRGCPASVLLRGVPAADVLGEFPALGQGQERSFGR